MIKQTSGSFLCILLEKTNKIIVLLTESIFHERPYNEKHLLCAVLHDF
jgi:hypothetical protein